MIDLDILFENFIPQNVWDYIRNTTKVFNCTLEYTLENTCFTNWFFIFDKVY